MPAINFRNAFEALQLSPGVSFTEIKYQYEHLVSSKNPNANKSQEGLSPQDIAAAYNDLQLLTKPYEELSQIEQASLLDAFNEMPELELTFWLQLYPHNTTSFYWHSKSYPQLATNLATSLYKTTAHRTASSVGTFFSMFTSCYSNPGIVSDNEYQEDVELPLWTKKTQ
ncbi:hypothetical protein [Legionella hackeliae]|uniref:J domain-containing protein n=1 Tax=Legionella hackeliae TaxID=449 RepID=A0A0A8UKZ9_LEGHA|nr:hypothetical protein [Legionella hackeliae]KTD13565.1 hypothetical protein Lhac_0949 [Legionella hackeliae]CEK09413.1 protein of unknown function [Legionella hackeliae]STX49321.1 Uncharacterised protein [Legionella hackeliae]